MNSSNLRQLFSLAAILLLTVTTTFALAQNAEDRSSDSGVIQDEIPEEALRTPEGQQLADRLRILRRSQASMGPNHPSFGGIQAEINGIRAKLGLSPNGAGESDRLTLDSMDEDELRQLIRRMALRIESLERRVDALERRLEVF